MPHNPTQNLYYAAPLFHCGGVTHTYIITHCTRYGSPDDINDDSAQNKYWRDVTEEGNNVSWKLLGDTPGNGDTEG